MSNSNNSFRDQEAFERASSYISPYASTPPLISKDRAADSNGGEASQASHMPSINHDAAHPPPSPSSITASLRELLGKIQQLQADQQTLLDAFLRVSKGSSDTLEALQSHSPRLRGLVACVRDTQNLIAMQFIGDGSSTTSIAMEEGVSETERLKDLTMRVEYEKKQLAWRRVIIETKNGGSVSFYQGQMPEYKLIRQEHLPKLKLVRKRVHSRASGGWDEPPTDKLLRTVGAFGIERDFSKLPSLKDKKNSSTIVAKRPRLHMTAPRSLIDSPKFNSTLEDQSRATLSKASSAWDKATAKEGAITKPLRSADKVSSSSAPSSTDNPFECGLYDPASSPELLASSKKCARTFKIHPLAAFDVKEDGNYYAMCRGCTARRNESQRKNKGKK